MNKSFIIINIKKIKNNQKTMKFNKKDHTK